MALLRDRLIARLADVSGAPDYQQLAEEVLGIRNAPPELARRLVSQALVVEDRSDAWRRLGERICATAPGAPGVYVLRDGDGRALYVGKAVNLRRRLRAHFAPRRWRTLKPGMTRAADAEWQVVGSELEALLREAVLIHALQPTVNVQSGEPAAAHREVPRRLLRDLIVILPSVEEGAAELVAVRPAGQWLLQPIQRSGVDLVAHTSRLMRFFHSPLWRSGLDRRGLSERGQPGRGGMNAAPIVFSWLAGRGSGATRLDPHDVTTRRELAARLAALLADDRLFADRIDQRFTYQAARRLQ